QPTDHHGMTRRLQRAHVRHAGALESRGRPTRSVQHVTGTIGLGADAGDLHEVDEIGDVRLSPPSDLGEGLVNLGAVVGHDTTYPRPLAAVNEDLCQWGLGVCSSSCV